MNDYWLKRRDKVSLALFMLMAVMSCGYQLKDRGLSAPEGVQTIAVPVFENQTSEIGLETVFADDLAYEFTRSKVLRLVDQGSADGIVRGAITSIKDSTVAWTSDYDASENLVIVQVSSSFMRRDGRVLWADSHLSDREAYRVFEIKQLTEESKRAAIKAISKRLAERMHNQVLEDY